MKEAKLSLEVAEKMYESNDEAIKAFALENYPDLCKNKVVKWEDLDISNGFYINNESLIYNLAHRCYLAKNNDQNVFATEAQAKSALAMAQLSQLMKEFNGYWVADWGNPNQVKHTLHRHGNFCCRSKERNTYYFLSFESDKKSNEFHELHEYLICEYLIIE